MILDEILKNYCDDLVHGNITHLELSTTAFNEILKESKDMLVAQSEVSRDNMQEMTINGKPIKLIQDDDIWFKWK